MRVQLPDAVADADAAEAAADAEVERFNAFARQTMGGPLLPGERALVKSYLVFATRDQVLPPDTIKAPPPHAE